MFSPCYYVLKYVFLIIVTYELLTFLTEYLTLRFPFTFLYFIIIIQQKFHYLSKGTLI